MTKQSIDSGRNFTKILLSVIPAVIFIVGVLVSINSGQPSVKEQVEVVRQGYEPVPHLYYVDASFSKAWKDGGSIWLVLLGIIISSVGTWAYLTYVYKELKFESIAIIAILWIGGAVIIFTKPLRLWGSSSYSSTLSPEEYEKYKNNLDQIFPSIEKAEK